MPELALHLVDEGPKDALPVLLLHAFPLSSAMWDEQRRALAGKARVLAFDVRGLGKSPRAAMPLMLEHVVDDALAVLDHAGVRAALVVGLSMGGYVALRAAERAPERIAGLLLCDTQAAADSDEAKLKRAAGVRTLEAKGVAAYAEGFVAGALSAETRASRPQVVARLHQLIAESSKEGIAAALVALATRTDTRRSLGAVRAKTHVVVGEHDALTTPEVARDLAAAIPGAGLSVLAGAGHLSNLEAPEAFNEALLGHLARVREG
jgi:pimeloyl-ACP methyl ester carboxylesterase